VGKDSGAFAFDVLIKPNAGANLGQQGPQRGLADIERLTPEVISA
jgi:hypothetical protein